MDWYNTHFGLCLRQPVTFRSTRYFRAGLDTETGNAFTNLYVLTAQVGQLPKEHTSIAFAWRDSCVGKKLPSALSSLIFPYSRPASSRVSILLLVFREKNSLQTKIA